MSSKSRINRLQAESKILIPSAYSALEEIERDDNFPIPTEEVYTYFKENYEDEDILQIISIYENSEQREIEWFLAVANLIGKVVTSRTVNSNALTQIQDGEIYEDALGGIESALNINTQLVLPAYLCAKYELLTEDDFSEFNAGISFNDLSELLTSEDYISLNYRLTKTAQFGYRPQTFRRNEGGIINLEKYFKNAAFTLSWQERCGDKPIFYIEDICKKDIDGHILFSRRFQKFLHDFIVIVNSMEEPTDNEVIEPPELSGSIGCPISYKVKSSLPEDCAGRDEIKQNDEIVRKFLSLLAIQYQSMGASELVTDFRPFCLVN